MKVLVTGGAGYIGSFMVKRLVDDRHQVVVIDSLERGQQDRIDKRARLRNGNITDQTFLNKVFSEEKAEAVIHFAGFIAMGESMEKPWLYFHNNTYAGLQMLEAMKNNGVAHIIFSSTAGVYGNPVQVPIPEDHPKNPENPYGESKLMVERILSWYQKIHHINFASLRYFNACGAALDGSMGEDHTPESHIIPNAIHAVLQKKPFTLFGTDYKTPDGTCVRDYIHVLDLVDAHVLALQKLQRDPGGYYYNVGTGKGFSNREVLQKVKEVSSIDFEITEAPRRPGDADTLVSDPTRINTELGFLPKYSDLDTIVKSAWSWHINHLSTQ